MRVFDRRLSSVLTAGFLAAGVVLNVASAMAKPITFKIGDPSKRDVVTFDSDAPVEVITGTTNAIKGTVTLDDSFKFDKDHPFDINFKVDLRTIDTGISLRNAHMRDNFLETDAHPYASFKATSVKINKKPDLSKIGTYTLKATGDFTVHGVTVRKTIPLKVTYMPESTITKKRFPTGNLIRINGTFPVTLTAHKIKRPEAVFVKLAETVFVKINAMGTDGRLK